MVIAQSALPEFSQRRSISYIIRIMINAGTGLELFAALLVLLLEHIAAIRGATLMSGYRATFGPSGDAQNSEPTARAAPLWGICRSCTKNALALEVALDPRVSPDIIVLNNEFANLIALRLETGQRGNILSS